MGGNTYFHAVIGGISRSTNWAGRRACREMKYLETAWTEREAAPTRRITKRCFSPTPGGGKV